MNAPTADQPLIRAVGLVKEFGLHRALHKVDLEIARGERLVIIGPSGSGKSTLIRCLNGLVKPNDGSIIYEGRALEMQSRVRLAPFAPARRHGVSGLLAISASNGAWKHYPCTRACWRVFASEAEIEARRLLERVHLPDKADAYPARLSGGQQQRAAIARALAMRPEIMLFDEPTPRLTPR